MKRLSVLAALLAVVSCALWVRTRPAVPLGTGGMRDAYRSPEEGGAFNGDVKRLLGDLKNQPGPVAAAGSPAAPARGVLHRSECVSLNSDYQPDGGSFVFEMEKGGRAHPTVKEVRNLDILLKLRPFDEDGSFRVCKRKDGGGKDLAHSYEICGFDANLYPADEGRRFAGGLLPVNQAGRIMAGFNHDAAIPRFQEQISTGDLLRGIAHPDFGAEKLFQLESASDALGHIVVFKKGGGIDYARTVRIQCRSLSDNATVIPGANH